MRRRLPGRGGSRKGRGGQEKVEVGRQGTEGRGDSKVLQRSRKGHSYPKAQAFSPVHEAFLEKMPELFVGLGPFHSLAHDVILGCLPQETVLVCR